jgi:hypothetical protein
LRLWAAAFTNEGGEATEGSSGCADAFEKKACGEVGVGGVTKVVGGSTIFGGVEGVVVMNVGRCDSDLGVEGRGEEAAESFGKDKRSGNASAFSATGFFLGKVNTSLSLSAGD